MARIKRSTAKHRTITDWGSFDQGRNNTNKFVKPEEGQPICPHCKSGVGVAPAGWSDKELGITTKTLLIKRHAFGGKVARKSIPCPGSWLVYNEEKESTR